MRNVQAVIRILAALAIGQAGPARASTWFDPTASVVHAEQLRVEDGVYVGPFAVIRAHHPVSLGAESNVQDSARIDAGSGAVRLGERAILAHGATVRGPASVGEEGSCPGGAATCSSFVGFNAVVEGAVVEKDAMVGHLAWVGPGVTIPSGRKVRPGARVASAADADAKTEPLTEADRAFMAGVVEVNVALAHAYPALAPREKRGVNLDPGALPLLDNGTRELPSLGGVSTRDPGFRNRIIGDVRTDDPLDRLDEVMGSRISLRADEGPVIELGRLRHMGDGVTFHALEGTVIRVGPGGSFGEGALVHGGGARGEPASTAAGRRFTLGEGAVFFRSVAGDDVTVGEGSLVMGAALPSGFRVPPRTVVTADEAGRLRLSPVEW